jgi:hypothetical protein
MEKKKRGPIPKEPGELRKLVRFFIKEKVLIKHFGINYKNVRNKDILLRPEILQENKE